MPKATKPNAFFNFMITWKQKQEKKGRKFPEGLKDVQKDPECNAEWQSMSADDKLYYKNLQIERTPKPVAKKTGIGEALELVEREKLKQQQFRDKMVEEIRGLVNRAKQTNSIPQLQFYVVHVNYFYAYMEDNETRELKYHPAEIAIAEFSLEKGITRTYHQIINQKIRLGYTGTAKEKSMSSHQIPINAPMGKNNYQEIFNEICEFIRPGSKGGKLPPLYTLRFTDEIHNPIKSVLGLIAFANALEDSYFELYSFEELFSTIHNAIIDITNDSQIEPLVAVLVIKKDIFAFKSGLACDYHCSLEAGQEFCSLSYVKRWIYVLCNHCCSDLEIEMIAGKHKPHEKNYFDESFRSLNSSFSSCRINESGHIRSCISMTGVSNEHRERVSQRNFEEEKRRRSQAAKSKPLTIIDYSKINEKKVQEPVPRPLRAPFTKSAVINIDTSDTESIDFSESSFPSIGRGTSTRNKNDKIPGGGYAGCLKKF